MRQVEKGVPDHAIGRSLGGLSAKINAIVDGNRLPIHLALTPSHATDKDNVALIASITRISDLIADRGYDARAPIDLARTGGTTVHIPSQYDRRVQRTVEPTVTGARQYCRALLQQAYRFDKLVRNFLAAGALASIGLWTRACESMTYLQIPERVFIRTEGLIGGHSDTKD